VGFFDWVGDIARVAAPILTLVNPPLGIAVGSIGGAVGQIGQDPVPPYSPPAPSVPLWQAPAGQYRLPDIGQLTGVPSFLADPVVQTEGVALPAAAGGAIMGLTVTLARTIGRLAARLGIQVLSIAGLARVGSRIWRSLNVFARRHPSISLISMLAALGLTIEEASEFIAWGSTRRRRRRGGISGRDMRTAKRTIRRIASFQHDLAHLRAHAGGGFRRGASRRSGGVSVVRAG